MDKNLIKHKLPKTAKTFEVRNPANNKLLATLPSMDAKQVRAATEKTVKAFEKWSALTSWDRSKIMHEWFRLIQANKEKLSQIMHEESGKLLPECITEIDYAASFIDWYAEEAKRVYGEIIPMPNQNRGIITKQPVGPVAAITPWNFPAAMITRKTSPALAVGCSVIVKPPKATPLSALALYNLAIEAGMPEGVFEIVLGESDMIGKELSSHPGIKKLSFTGSTEVGKQLMAQCATTMKQVTMELGGNAPFIVFADADIGKAVEGAIKSRFRFSGQTCICANRFLVEDKIHDEFAKKLAAKVKGMKIAPLINKDAIKKVDKLVKNAGGKILCGGKHHGNFFDATVIADVKKSNDIYATEIFGPVATLFKFKTENEAIEMANGTPYGLASYVYSEDLKKAWRVAEKIDFGMVGVNEVAISSSYGPFGGFKESGIGREGSHYGVEEYVEIKYINFGA